MTKRSARIEAGIWQWEWRKGAIAVARWDHPPVSTDQWVKISPSIEHVAFYLEGTSNSDIRVVALTAEELLEAQHLEGMAEFAGFYQDPKDYEPA